MLLATRVRASAKIALISVSSSAFLSANALGYQDKGSTAITRASPIAPFVSDSVGRAFTRAVDDVEEDSIDPSLDTLPFDARPNANATTHASARRMNFRVRADRGRREDAGAANMDDARHSLTHNFLNDRASMRFCGVPLLRPDASTRANARTLRDDPNAALERKITVKSMLVVANGAKDGKDCDEVKRMASARGIACSVVKTTGVGHCVEIVRDADLRGVDVVGVVGGDGTFREAVQGWIERRKRASDGETVTEETALLAFPCGTGNNYARDLGVKTIEDAFGKVDAGKCRKVDAVKVRDGDGAEHVSVNVVTWGMARDAAETAEGMRWMGPLRYDVAGLWHILLNKKNKGTIGVSESFEGEIASETNDYLMMFAQNTRCSGRAFAFTPLAELDDGFFDVVVCDKGSMLRTKSLFDATKSGGGHVEDAGVKYVRAKRLSLSTESPGERVGIDGELTVPTPIHLTVLPGAFTTLV